MFLNLNLTTFIKLKTCEFELYNFRSEIFFHYEKNLSKI
jgi:hypothetical protein